MKFQLLFLFIFVIIITIYVALNGKKDNMRTQFQKPVPQKQTPLKPRPQKPPPDLLLPIVPKTPPTDVLKQNTINAITAKINENKIIDTKVENKKIQDNMLELNNLTKYLGKTQPKSCDKSQPTLKSALKSPGFVAKAGVKFNTVVKKQYIDMNEPTGAPVILADEKIQLAK